MTPDTRRTLERIEILLDLISCSPELKRELRRSIEMYGDSRHLDTIDKVFNSVDDLAMGAEEEVPF